MESDLFARFLNVGFCKDASIRDFAQLIAEIIRYRGALV